MKICGANTGKCSSKTPNTLGTYIAGVILHEETIKQKTDEKINIPELIDQNHAIAGIKVDKGAHPLAKCEGEKITEGLDGLRNRLQEFYKIGARFREMARRHQYPKQKYRRQKTNRTLYQSKCTRTRTICRIMLGK